MPSFMVSMPGTWRIEGQTETDRETDRDPMRGVSFIRSSTTHRRISVRRLDEMACFPSIRPPAPARWRTTSQPRRVDRN